MGWVIVAFFVVVFIVGMVKAAKSPQVKTQREYQGKKLSEVGKQTAAGLACPNCGSTSFTAKRSAGGKLAGGVLAPKSRVRCTACGVEFVRG